MPVYTETALSADGSTTARQVKDNAYSGAGPLPEVIIVTSGTFGGGTLTVQYSVDNSTYVSDSTLAFTAAGTGVFKVSPGLWYKATLAGATGPTVAVTFLS